MAKEEDPKRVDLKVSVNCCEGCKKKVLKALSIKGVLKTEVHPTLPKITVTGNVDVPILIKKLKKIGKSAELWPSENKGEDEQNKGVDTHIKGGNNVDKDKESSYETVVTAIPQTNDLMNPNGMPPYVQGYYPMQRVNSVPVAYFAMNMNAYADSPPCFIHDCCHCQLPAYHPPAAQSRQNVGFTDYFNDENTEGCHVM